MSGTATFYLLSQLGYSAPALLVYLVAFILALSYRDRAPRASTLTFAGVGVLVFATIAGVAGQAYLFHSMVNGGQGSAWTSQLIGVVGFATSCVRAIGLALLVAAIFTGRGRRSSPHEEPEARRLDDEPRRVHDEGRGRFREGRGP